MRPQTQMFSRGIVKSEILFAKSLSLKMFHIFLHTTHLLKLQPLLIGSIASSTGASNGFLKYHFVPPSFASVGAPLSNGWNSQLSDAFEECKQSDEIASRFAGKWTGSVNARRSGKGRKINGVVCGSGSVATNESGTRAMHVTEQDQPEKLAKKRFSSDLC